MNGRERRGVWKNLKQQLGFKGMGCYGAMWSSRTRTLTIMQQEEQEETHTQNAAASVTMDVNMSVNLAMALAAERDLPGGGADSVVGPTKNAAAGTTVKTLMMLIEETDGGDWKIKKEGDLEEGGGGEGTDWMCCVCMERNKGTAFIPCGHTFCRVCSRDLWLNRGSCPICSRSIVEILDIF